MSDKISLSRNQYGKRATHTTLQRARIISSGVTVSAADKSYNLELARIDDSFESIAAFDELYSMCCEVLGSSIKLDKAFMAAFRASYNIVEDDVNDNYWLLVKSIEGFKTCGRYTRALGQTANVERFNLSYDIVNKGKPAGTGDLNEALIGQMCGMQCLELLTSNGKIL